MSIGKQIRLNRLFRNNCAFIVALDHGFSYSDTKGMENLSEIIKKSLNSDIDGLILNRGGFNYLSDYKVKMPVLVLHAGGGGISGDNKKEKFITNRPKEAIKLGADGVSFQINIGSASEIEQIKEASQLISEANEHGLFTILMIYDKRNGKENNLNDCVRLGEELGADIIKINPDLDYNQVILEKILRNTGVPVVVAGGNPLSQEEYLKKTKIYAEMGASGVSIGRNFINAENQDNFLEEVRKVYNKTGNHAPAI